MWDAMAEWDQAGGAWVPNGRPRYTGLSRKQAYEKFTGYYLNQRPPLGKYLAQPRKSRDCTLLAQTDFPANVAYGYEMGVDVTMLCFRLNP